MLRGMLPVAGMVVRIYKFPTDNTCWGKLT